MIKIHVFDAIFHALFEKSIVLNEKHHSEGVLMQNRCFQRKGGGNGGQISALRGGPNSVLSLKTVFASLKQRLLKEDKAKLTHAKAK